MQSADTNGTLNIGLGSNLIYGGTDFIGCRQIGSGNWFAVIHSGGADIATADTGVAHDTNVHRLVVDNNNGAPNTIRCTVDGGTPAVASGTVPAEYNGWNFAFGANSDTTTANFGAYQYTIFLQGLPRQ
jgi:hypothetical protein